MYTSETFANMIAQISPKKVIRNKFHYTNPRMAIWGRDRELKSMQKFLEESQPILYMSVIGPAGCGKSKLVYEFVRNNRYDEAWEMKYLDALQIESLCGFKEYSYPKNLVLIVEHAGLYIDAIRQWLERVIAVEATARPGKLRLILMEREGELKVDNMVLSPFWKQALKGLEHLEYIKEPFSKSGELRELEDEYLRKMADSYSEIQSEWFDKEIIDGIMEHMNRITCYGMMKSRPLLVLLIADAVITGENVYEWDYKEFLEFCLRKHGKQLEYLCSNESKNIALYTGVLNTAEPDLLGEYFLFWKLQSVSHMKRKFCQVMDELWELPEKFVPVMYRTICDYKDYGEFVDFIVEEIDTIFPEKCYGEKQAEWCARLLNRMLLTFTMRKRRNAVAEKIKILYQVHPRNLVVVEAYAAMLMMDYRNYLNECWKQEENIREIAQLRNQFPESEYILIMYQKSLSNQISDYVEELRECKKKTENSVRVRKIRKHVKTLKALHEQYPDNLQIENALEMGVIFLKTVC